MEPIQEPELRELLRQGIANNEITSFDSVAFSSDLVPWNVDASTQTRWGSEKFTVVYGSRFYLYADQEKKGFNFTIKGGITFPKRHPISVRLYAQENPLVDEPVVQMTLADDLVERAVHLDSPFKGVHRLELQARGRTEVSWPKGQRVSVPVSPTHKTPFIGPAYTMAFYVPTGKKVVGGFFESNTGTMHTSSGRTIFKFSEMERPNYFVVAVPAGEDGSWWWFVDAKGSNTLLTVPPYLMRSPSEALMPSEVK